MAALKYWIWLADARVRACAKGAVLRAYGDAQRAFFAPEGEITRLDGVSRADADVLERRDLSAVEEIVDECTRQGIEIITYEDRAYPARLRNITAPPPVLYVKGKLPEIDDRAAIAVIGTRSATSYGLKMARGLAAEIVQCGGLIVSGLTRGIDGAAAVGALKVGGRCIGVLGTAHETENSALAKTVLERGALVSEYAPGTPPKRSFFRDRNRIAAGLAVGVLAVEAPAQSGTRLFVEEAAEQGKELFAVPGNADAANSVGTIDMLRDGAKLVTTGWDVMSEFEWRYPETVKCPETGTINAAREAADMVQNEEKAPIRRKKTKKVIDKPNAERYIDLKAQLDGLNETQLKIISAIEPDGTHIDDIIETSGLSAAVVLAQLTLLELKGFVYRQSGRRFSLNTAKK